MFCPNCGTENEETATPCKKCGFKLRGVSAPKFKGTMLLNSDQAVQKLVQEARRRLEQDSSPESGHAPLPQNGGQSASWGNQPAGLRTLNGGLQPPRVTSARVDRTMMGVAPQMGGFAPPSVGADPALAESESNLRQGAAAASAEAPAMSSELAPASSSELAPKLEGFSSSQALGLDARAANDGPGHWPGGTVNESPESAQRAAEDAPERVTTEVGIPTVGQNAAPDIAAPPKAEGKLAAPPGLRRRVHPLEIVLVLLTFGLYGFVLWARRRKRGKRAPAPAD
ncbi:MAG TPA: zinc-ribbon domain-containing protein [Polyangiaceae bacterium]|nr:zinc-ribbon domain-containing protein [Polyangiaceae bacterium]